MPKLVKLSPDQEREVKLHINQEAQAAAAKLETAVAFLGIQQAELGQLRRDLAAQERDLLSKQRASRNIFSGADVGFVGGRRAC